MNKRAGAPYYEALGVTNGQQHAIGMLVSLPSAIDAPARQHPPRRRSSIPVGVDVDGSGVSVPRLTRLIGWLIFDSWVTAR